uniref:Uncharacterized protein n=1 Tax=Rhizophora mucronata TaxID=61149 RepID=A0A2P2N330_RHIMU
MTEKEYLKAFVENKIVAKVVRFRGLNINRPNTQLWITLDPKV